MIALARGTLFFCVGSTPSRGWRRKREADNEHDDRFSGRAKRTRPGIEKRLKKKKARRGKPRVIQFSWC